MKTDTMFLVLFFCIVFVVVVVVLSFGVLKNSNFIIDFILQIWHNWTLRFYLVQNSHNCFVTITKVFSLSVNSWEKSAPSTHFSFLTFWKQMKAYSSRNWQGQCLTTNFLRLGTGNTARPLFVPPSDRTLWALCVCSRNVNGTKVHFPFLTRQI